MLPPLGQVDLQLHQFLVADPGSKRASIAVWNAAGWCAAEVYLKADCSAAAGVCAGSQVEVRLTHAEKQVSLLYVCLQAIYFLMKAFGA